MKNKILLCITLILIFIITCLLKFTIWLSPADRKFNLRIYHKQINKYTKKYSDIQTLT